MDLVCVSSLEEFTWPPFSGFEFRSVPLRDDNAWQLIRERAGNQEGQGFSKDMILLCLSSSADLIWFYLAKGETLAGDIMYTYCAW